MKWDGAFEELSSQKPHGLKSPNLKSCINAWCMKRANYHVKV